MSSASSVASSFASVGSSSPSTPAPVCATQPLDRASDSNDEDSDAYSDDFAASEDPVGVVHEATKDDGNYGAALAQDDDNYDDDAFEDTEDAIDQTATARQGDPVQQDEHAAEYSDAFEYSEDFDDGGQATPLSDGFVAVTAPKALESEDPSHVDAAVHHDSSNRDRHEQGVQHPGPHLHKLTNDWADSKLRLIAQRNSKPSFNNRACSSHRRIELHGDASASLLERLRKRQSSDRKSTAERSGRRRWPRVPTPLVDRVRVHKLLALSAQHPPSAVDSPPRSTPRSLKTFCSVKTADLEGKLATEQLGDLCARWESSGENVLSAATSEFLSSILAQQRLVLRPSPSESVLGTLRTHATAMDRAVETATLAVEDSRQLLNHAHAVLHAPDKHTCTCPHRSHTPKTA